ncbi:MAG: hypothetical protein NTY38_00385, partial [Acidobacteria bacterium]|nr:hypothetical protein [Acidobacteriota bacterium]
MALNFSPSAQAALALAKRCVPAGGMLDIPGLMAAVCHQTEIAAEEPEAAAALDRPVPLRADSDAPVPVAPELQEVFRDLHARGEEITPRILFTELAVRGAFVREVSPVKAQPVWKSSPERQQAIRDLAAYGRMLTDAELPYRGLVEMDAALESLIITLSTSGRKNA